MSTVPASPTPSTDSETSTGPTVLKPEYNIDDLALLGKTAVAAAAIAGMSTLSSSLGSSSSSSSVSPVATFLDLLEDNPSWRNKLLKDVQYGCKVTLASGVGPGKKGSDTAVRLKACAKALSLSRRVMILGSSLSDAADLVTSLSALVSRRGSPWECAVTAAGAASTLLDDVSTCSAISLIPEKYLPEGFDRAADIAWTINIVLDVLDLYFKLRRAKDPFSRMLLVISIIKLLADLGQAAPGAADVDSPPLVDASFGMVSGLLSTYKIWAKATRRT